VSSEIEGLEDRITQAIREKTSSLCSWWCTPGPALRGSVSDGRFREARVAGLQLLQADDVRLGRLQPFEQVRQRAIDVVDVEGGVPVASNRRRRIGQCCSPGAMISTHGCCSQEST
jgi:hypothetical protein